MSIPLTPEEQVLAVGWYNKNGVDLSRVIQPGQVVTVVLSDAPFDVPNQVAGANILGSRQHEFESLGLVKIRVLERQ
jgi:hypothetical protein